MTTKYFTKQQLIRAASMAGLWDYNRQLSAEAVKLLLPIRYPVMMTLLHEHRHGMPCEPHVRCAVDIVGDLAIFDIPCEFFNSLSTAEQRAKPTRKTRSNLHLCRSM